MLLIDWVLSLICTQLYLAENLLFSDFLHFCALALGVFYHAKDGLKLTVVCILVLTFPISVNCSWINPWNLSSTITLGGQISYSESVPDTDFWFDQGNTSPKLNTMILEQLDNHQQTPVLQVQNPEKRCWDLSIFESITFAAYLDGPKYSLLGARRLLKPVWAGVTSAQPSGTPKPLGLGSEPYQALWLLLAETWQAWTGCLPSNLTSDLEVLDFRLFGHILFCIWSAEFSLSCHASKSMLIEFVAMIFVCKTRIVPKPPQQTCTKNTCSR